MKAGLNLYSIRSFIKTEENFLDTAKKLKAMGYDYVQFSGVPMSMDVAEQIARVSKETELPVYLTHCPLDRILNEPEQLMEEHAKFNCKNIGLGGIPNPTIVDEKLCKETYDKLNLVGEKMAKNGFKFFYHNHNKEFWQYADGDTPFDYMIENTPYINFTVDTYWLQYGGVDVVDFLERLAGRIECVHLKDYRQKYNEETTLMVPKFAPVGDGMMNFPKIVAKMKELGVKYYFVEQDDAVSYDDPLGQVERSIRYITLKL